MCDAQVLVTTVKMEYVIMESSRIENSTMTIAKRETALREAIIKISGEMDARGCKSLKTNIIEILDDMQADYVSLDLSDVSFIDSSGIGSIVFMFKKLKAKNKHFQMVGVNGQPEDILRLLRVDKVIPMQVMNIEI